MNHLSIRVAILIIALIVIGTLSVTAAGDYPQPTICERACWSARDPQCAIDVEPEVKLTGDISDLRQRVHRAGVGCTGRAHHQPGE